MLPYFPNTSLAKEENHKKTLKKVCTSHEIIKNYSTDIVQSLLCHFMSKKIKLSLRFLVKHNTLELPFPPSSA